MRAAVAAGIEPGRIAVDPGLGFGKTMADNWRLALRAGEIGGGFSVVVGASRKRFLDTPVPGDVSLPAGWAECVERLRPRGNHPRDAASGALALLTGTCAIHRVHNVGLVTAEG